MNAADPRSSGSFESGTQFGRTVGIVRVHLMETAVRKRPAHSPPPAPIAEDESPPREVGAEPSQRVNVRTGTCVHRKPHVRSIRRVTRPDCPRRVTLCYQALSRRSQGPRPPEAAMSRQGRELDPDSLAGFFGAELRARREGAGLSMAQLAKNLGYTPQWIGAVELSDEAPSEDFARDVDTYFQTGLFHRLWRANKRAIRNLVLPLGFPRYLALEAKATLIRSFETQVLPGLLQIEPYARAVLRAGRPRSSEEEIDELLAARLERQALLTSASPPNCLFVVDEAAIRRPYGETAVLQAQLDHLHKVTALPNVQFQVLPFSAGPHAALDGAFQILSFEDAPDAVYVDGPSNGWFIEKPDMVNSSVWSYDLMRTKAASPEESLLIVASAWGEK
ncbi:helix-turn-helix domain-containing protein [Actinomadura rudentiformis]|uniref:Transcriptional regulator n=1 Tax=Actinomadura rudentiformis TaxID=359158 RepID=A0A6H9YJW7_9ACTN|nr:helix-turn-helix transcriptional regulator [Actinomadura rudentiformis]KAB2341325.1 transcriptional regulator [Actinomadura rudentiformis]